MIAEVMINERIDVLFVDETRLTFGTNIDLSCFGPFTVYNKERDPGIKPGGGLALIIFDGIQLSPCSLT